MSTIQIKNVPEPVHAELRRRATQANQSIRDYVLTLIERDQSLPSKSDWLDEVAQDPPVDIGMSGAEAVQAGRDERDAELFSVLVRDDKARR